MHKNQHPQPQSLIYNPPLQNTQDQYRNQPIQHHMNRYISINLTIYNHSGTSPQGNHFTYTASEQFGNQQIQHYRNNSSEEEIDYNQNDSSQEEQFAVQVRSDNDSDDEDNRIFHFHLNQQQSLQSNEEVEEESNRQSPFFGNSQQSGLTQSQINSLPTMKWSQAHNLFNGGQKCSICMQQYRIGSILRVLQCLHRYHSDCLDPWLSSNPSCPNCRTTH